MRHVLSGNPVKQMDANDRLDQIGWPLSVILQKNTTCWLSGGPTSGDTGTILGRSLHYVGIPYINISTPCSCNYNNVYSTNNCRCFIILYKHVRVVLSPYRKTNSVFLRYIIIQKTHGLHGHSRSCSLPHRVALVIKLFPHVTYVLSVTVLLKFN